MSIFKGTPYSIILLKIKYFFHLIVYLFIRFGESPYHLIIVVAAVLVVGLVLMALDKIVRQRVCTVVSEDDDSSMVYHYIQLI